MHLFNKGWPYRNTIEGKMILMDQYEYSDWTHSVQIMATIKHMNIASILLTSGQDSVILKAHVEFAH